MLGAAPISKQEERPGIMQRPLLGKAQNHSRIPQDPETVLQMNNKYPLACHFLMIAGQGVLTYKLYFFNRSFRPFCVFPCGAYF